MIGAKNFPYLPISDGNHLVHTSSKSTQRKGMDNDDDHYDEVNSDGEVVAKYYIWHHMSIYPPQNVNEGWEKYNLAGEKIASGKCK